MTRLVKIPTSTKASPVKPEQVKLNYLPVFVQTNRVTNREQTYLKIKGAYKAKVQNKGDVDVIIFGTYRLPSYSEETFDLGDINCGFSGDSLIEYSEQSTGENIDVLVTTYFKTT